MKDLVKMNAAAGLLLSLIALPMVANLIKPNLFYGFRVKQTLEDPEVWYKTNHYAGKHLLASGIFISGSAITLSFIPGISVDVYALLTAAVAFLALGFSVVRSWRYMKSIL